MDGIFAVILRSIQCAPRVSGTQPRDRCSAPCEIKKISSDEKEKESRSILGPDSLLVWQEGEKNYPGGVSLQSRKFLEKY
jgi:hypothetical protein